MPILDEITSSPSADLQDRRYTESFAHPNETAEAGYYQLRFRNGINTELTATPRTGSARITFPSGEPAFLLIRSSETGPGPDGERPSRAFGSPAEPRANGGSSTRPSITPSST